MITPNEFLQFAREMGLEQIPQTSLTDNVYALTGLSVLNNLCHLIEQIHTLKTENDRLRAHLELVKHMEKFSPKQSSALSPSNSWKMKKQRSATFSTSRHGPDFVNNPEDSSSMPPIESEIFDSNLGSSWNNWGKVRHALKSSLRRKADPPINSTLIIPTISISAESDDDHQRYEQKKISMTNDNRGELFGEDTDPDDESIEWNTTQQKREAFRTYSSSNEINTATPIDDEQLFARKQSKIAHYRRKLRSKLNTVKRQFSDQTLASSARLIPYLQASTFDEIGSGINHALLTVQLAPAMTESYQQKMREWQTMQKSQFLVNYRRQSIAIKTESRRTSTNETISVEAQIPCTDQSDADSKIDIRPLSPTLSPNQRSLIVHQWREIMVEEISLRLYNEYLQKKMQDLKQLETDLKSLKTSIFSTNNQDYLLKHRSMTTIDQLDQDLLDQHRPAHLSQRSRSLQSLQSMPASWILAVQSAAYSDLLDGTSKRTTDRAIIFNKNFFRQLNHFKINRINFELSTLKNLPLPINPTSTNISSDENCNEKESMRIRTRRTLNRAYLQKLSFMLPSEMSPVRPGMPFQTVTSTFEPISHIELATISETESSLPSPTSLNKHGKHSRFHLKKTLQRSRSMCISQFQSWLQRRRQQHSVIPRRKSAAEPKSTKDILSSPSSTPKFLASPRLARLHQRIFKQHPSPIPLLSIRKFPPLPSPPAPSSQFDDSDQHFKKQESPVRIYLPARTSPSTRHVQIVHNGIQTPPMSKVTSPVIHRRTPASVISRESSATFSDLLNNQ